MFQEQNLLNYPVLEDLLRLEIRSAHTLATVPLGDSFTSHHGTGGHPSGHGTFNPHVNRVMINNSTFYTYNYAQPEDHASLISAKSNVVSETPSVEKAEAKLSHKRSNTIYENQLMCKGRGFPLWVPQPNMRLPATQRAKGVSIGDVGIITEYGAFDFLFNICTPPDDPEKINPTDLPDGFTTLELKPWDVREFRDFPNGSYLAGPRVGKATKGEDSRTTAFESSAGESALLAMPEGAYHEEANDLSKFREYARQHVESWYTYVLHQRGRKDTANGDIRLVVGIDKSTSWGIASFSEPFKLQLKEKEDLTTNRDPPYTWEHTGTSGEVKAGPDNCDNEGISSTAGNKVRNQTLFVRTLNVLLAKDYWDVIRKPKEVFDEGTCKTTFSTCSVSDAYIMTRESTLKRKRSISAAIVPDEILNRSKLNFTIGRGNRFVLTSDAPRRNEQIDSTYSRNDNLVWDNRNPPMPSSSAQQQQSGIDVISKTRLARRSKRRARLMEILREPSKGLATPHSSFEQAAQNFNESSSNMNTLNHDSKSAASHEMASTNLPVDSEEEDIGRQHISSAVEADTNRIDSVYSQNVVATKPTPLFNNEQHTASDTRTPTGRRPRLSALNAISGPAEERQTKRERFRMPHDVDERAWARPIENLSRDVLNLAEHPSLATNSWLLGVANLPPVVKMAITHDYAWSWILLDESLTRTYRMRLPYQLNAWEGNDILKSLYNIRLSPGRVAVYLEPKDRYANTDPLRDVQLVENMVTNMRRHNGVVLDYLFDSIGGPMPLGSFDFNERQHQISHIKAQIIDKVLITPQSSTTVEVLKPLVYHPLRPVTLQVLFEILNGETTPQKACDANVVGALRHSLREMSMGTKAHEVLHKLANALLNRARDFSDNDNIEEAICYYQYLAPVTPRDTPQYLEIVLGLCTAYHFRHQLLHMSEDYEQLIHFLNIQNTLNYDAIFNSLNDIIKADQ